MASSPASRADLAAQLRVGAVLVGALALLGAVLGVVWELWSPPGPLGAVLRAGVQADETEAFVAGDGRYTLIVLVVGVLAGVAAWTLRSLRRVRGPVIAVGLVLGGLVGAALTEAVGYLLRGPGTDFHCNSETARCIRHLPLTVHMHGLLVGEALAAALVYSLCVAFAAADDLGRPDPAHDAGRLGPADEPPVALPVGSAPVASGGTEDGAQHPRGDGDGAGAAQ